MNAYCSSMPCANTVTNVKIGSLISCQFFRALCLRFALTELDYKGISGTIPETKIIIPNPRCVSIVRCKEDFNCKA
ncbi:hypothetical protein BpHYR1_039195 [Brachionus plicatilis]|uniref:Uncharacterized protein n=1 Tax=Brachionus plicatilis TaxID=10195 RepID=A0A3M7T5R6_BRAPC|nr:hypothetical protein BpHYR1_039195 [Brachionus plicatilis]